MELLSFGSNKQPQFSSWMTESHRLCFHFGPPWPNFSVPWEFPLRFTSRGEPFPHTLTRGITFHTNSNIVCGNSLACVQTVNTLKGVCVRPSGLVIIARSENFIV